MTIDLAHHRWHARLSELHDDTLAREESAACRAHLAICAECRADLQAIADVTALLHQHARTAPAAEPPEAVWAGIAAAIDGTTAAERVAPRRVPWRLAAAVAVIGFGAWLTRESLQRAAAPAPMATTATAPASVATARSSADAQAGVADLRRLLEEEGDRMSPATARALQEALAVIDEAVADAERAIAADSSNIYVAQHLARTRARRLTLLREAARLVQS